MSNKESLAVSTFLLIFIKYVFSGGNTSEELSFLPLFISLYFFCKIFFLQDKNIKKNAFIIGLCFSFIFWLRLNNALPIVAICISSFIYYLVEKDFKKLSALIGYFILGQLPFATLYLLYFAYYGAVYDLMYGTFLFNFMYLSSFIGFTTQYAWINILLTVTLLSGTLLYYSKYKDYKVIIASSLFWLLSILAANMGGGGMDHYFLITAPALIFGFIIILDGIQHKYVKAAILIIILLAILRLFYYGTTRIFFSQERTRAMYEEKHTTYKTILDIIPENERGKLYFYETLSEVYPILGINPNYKYFILQESHGSFDPNILKEINSMMQTTPPLWIVLYYPYLSENRYKNTEFVDILERDYVIRFENNTNTLLMYAPNGSDDYPKFAANGKRNIKLFSPTP